MRPETKKPRICEVLGVEVGEEWTVRGDEYDSDYRISVSGNLQMRGADGRWFTTGIHTENLTTAINHPESIKRKPRWTEEDIEDAKAIKRLFPGIETIHRGAYNSTGLYIHDTCHYRLNDELFPALKEGESVTLDEILEASREI